MTNWPSLQTFGSTVLVAGGGGFIGSAVVRELLASGFAVVSYDNYFHGSPDHVADLLGPFVAIDGDVRDEDQLEHTLRRHNVRYVIDCVGDTFVPDAYEVPQRFFDVNVAGTLSLLLAAKRSGVHRVVYTSSTEVYGSASGLHRIDERAALAPVNTYAVTKLAADRLCYTLHLEHQVPVVIARLFNSYGPRETHPYVIPEIISQVLAGGPVRLGNVEAQRDFTYVRDTAQALVSLLGAPLTNGEAVNVGSDTCVSVAELVMLVARIVGLDSVDMERDESRLRRRDIDWFRCDNSLLRSLTGWKPRVDLEDGLRRTVGWLIERGGLWTWERRSAVLPA